MTKAVYSSRPVKILMLANLFTLPYRVLRCAAAAGGEIYILGGSQAHALVYSRYCTDFIASNNITGDHNDRLVSEVNASCLAHAIDIVIPGDAPATRSLIAIRQQLQTRCFPLPTLEQFDLLNDKWKFTGLCDALGILHPRSWLYQDRAMLEAALRKNELPYPLIAKALSMDGGIGCVILEESNTTPLRLQQIDYKPIIVQELIAGEDIGSSVYCEKGVIKASIAHSYHRGVYSAFSGNAIANEIVKIATHLRLDGVYNFDMRRTQDGAVSYLECNPRFFYKMVLAMLAGVNFVEPGLYPTMQMPPATMPDDITVRLGKALLKSALAQGIRGKMNAKVYRYLLRDPVPYLRERAGLK